MVDSIEKGLLDKVGTGIFLTLLLTVLGTVLFDDFVSDYQSQFFGMFVGIATVSRGMMLTWAIKAQLEKEEYS